MFQNNRILLLINNEVLMRYLREHLIVEGGYSIVFESTAQSALSAMKQDSFDLIIVGVDIPGFEGAAIVKEIRKADPDAIIIVFSEAMDYDLMEQASSLGIYDFVSKPINQEKLFFLIRKGIERHSLVVTHHRLVSILKEQNTALQKQNIILAKRV